MVSIRIAKIMRGAEIDWIHLSVVPKDLEIAIDN
jgi:hypothetical protein